MAQVLRLARRGRGKTSPNPMVGALIVKKGTVIASGYHRRYGTEHAEAVALRRAGSRAKGATLYVNLEPCTHFGNTPPCCDSIIAHGIKRVVIANRDPNPLNDGRGIRRLRRSGIEVVSGVRAAEGARLNEFFLTFIRTRMPFVAVKIAESLDGKIAAARSGDSRWITSVQARQEVHRLRRYYDAVLVGSATVLKDNPYLSARLGGISGYRLSRTQPVKVILDSRLRIPENARIFSRRSPGRVIMIANTSVRRTKVRKIKRLQKKGHSLLFVSARRGKLSFRQILRALGKMSIASVLIEGGGSVIAGALEERVVQKVYFFIAPKILGGADALTAVEGRGVNSVRSAIGIRDCTVRKIGCDFLIEGLL
ncbi:MAG: bifunctional diaminohydroxyphosphoribosylaminopyrimidine deaminase/5-amino-6-(5-phosphoribosylamino)uracil reductase RibD [Candidatus Omnitrophica bacterium]|nr:bifunctional diaminohydroxyphosphoribosylaminopyrimidine deaminase/5-amino-6-(5-phosphoribosylamino)uracil reductase RibD [Candidatus Omnitrophota bacterium]